MSPQPAILADRATFQLTSDAARTDAHRFYERLGLHGSHVGFTDRVPEDAPRALRP